MSNSLQPYVHQPTRFPCPWDSPGTNPGVGCHAFLQGFFPTQGSNSCLLCLLTWQVGSLPVSHLGSHWILFICGIQRVQCEGNESELLLHVLVLINEIRIHYNIIGAFLVAQLVKIHLQCRRPQFNSWVRKIPWRKDRLPTPVFLSLPGGSVGKESACNARDLGSITGFGRSPGGGHGNLLQYSCLKNPQGPRSLAAYSPWSYKELGHDWAT